MGAVEVAVVESVALPDEGQRLRRVEMLATGGEPSARIRVTDRVIQTDVDAAERLGDVVEADEAHLGEPIDRHTGELTHRLDGLGATGLAAA